MNDPRMSGGPVSLENWSKPGMGGGEEAAPPEGESVIVCPECGARFKLEEPEKETNSPALPEEGMA